MSIFKLPVNSIFRQVYLCTGMLPQVKSGSTSYLDNMYLEHKLMNALIKGLLDNGRTWYHLPVNS